MVSDVSVNTALNQQAKTQIASDKLAEDFSQFLTLLTVQLQNQDPLSPMDTTEFTNQLVAFTGVEQQINTNQKLDSLVSLQLGNVMGSALGYVGLDASYISSEFYADGESPVTINYALNDVSVDATIRIESETGDLVYEGPAETSAGSHEFIWDGLDQFGNPAPAGTYNVRVDALDINDEAVGSTIVVEGRVRGVETQNGLVFLLIGERAVSVSNILNVSQPNSEDTTRNT
ncbi:MAG: flagellar hook capping family protein [Rhodospirillales bacterium]|nr:flagellar hook capping family protein [Alphaproteobacteria bacterium]USO04667.1 MAG: flagellar hook capping family protein [Rhodospirillales bacterium]